MLDLLDRDALAPTAERIIGELGHVDVLVNNAIYVGPAGERRFLDTPPDELEKRLFGNVAAQLLLLQPFLRHMVARRQRHHRQRHQRGRLHPAGARHRRGRLGPQLRRSKAGFHRIARQLVVEHGRDGIHVLNVQPGFVATERVLAAGEKLAFVARHASPVDAVGEALARIVDDPDVFDNGASVEIQDQARLWGCSDPARFERSSDPRYSP